MVPSQLERGGEAEGKGFKDEEAEAFPAGKFGFFPCLPQNTYSGIYRPHFSKQERHNLCQS